MRQYSSPFVIVLILLAAALVLGGSAVMAQEADPIEQLGMRDAIVSGDLNEPEWQAVQRFLLSLDFTTLGDDFEWLEPAEEDPLLDEDVAASNSILNQEIIADSGIDIETILVGDGIVATEFLVSGTWSGPLMGLSPTGAFVEIPVLGLFYFEPTGLASSVRLYYDARAALGVEGVSEPTDPEDDLAIDADEDDPLLGEDDEFEGELLDDEIEVDEDDAEDIIGVQETEIEEVDLDEVAGDPEEFIGVTVTVVGTLREYVGGDIRNGFILVEEDLIGDDPVLVIGADPDLFVDSWELETELIVTGVVRTPEFALLEEEIGYDLDDTLYAGYLEEDVDLLDPDDDEEADIAIPVIVAYSVVPADVE